MKKLITIITIAILTSCSPDETPSEFDGCQTVTNKESKYEYVGNNTYSTVYYLYLNGTKTKVSKVEFEKYSVGSEKCLDY